jgi:outer membrane protein OmpA-like peptidoglycan-associated protein/Tol biopolymer transport system component
MTFVRVAVVRNSKTATGNNTKVMKALKFIHLVVVFLLTVSSCSAQKEVMVTSDNKKAIKSFRKAEELYSSRQDAEAIKSLQKAIEQDNNFVEAYIFLSEIYISGGKKELAVDALQKSIEINPRFFPGNFIFLAQILNNLGRYEEGCKSIQHFELLKHPSKNLAELAQKAKNQCLLGIELTANPVPFEPINLGKNINTEAPEYFPSISADDSMLIFTRVIKNQAATDGIHEDFFVSYKQPDGNWSKAENIGSPLNTIQNEGAPSLAPDGQILVFAACEEYGSYGQNRKGYGSCDIFYSRRLGNQWGPGINMGPNINTSNYETQPSLSSDGRTLYFIRGFTDREKGVRTQNIYTSTLTDEGTWTKARPLSPVVNSEGREESPMIHPDGRTLYFASDGHPGLGGLDIFVTQRDDQGNWSVPKNLGYPINTFNDENSLQVSANGKLAYFASDREGGFGSLDLYQFELYEEARPIAVTYMKGIVYDEKTKKPLEAIFQLIDLETEELIVESYSNPKSGDFIVCIPTNKDYALNVSGQGYLFYSENFTLIGEGGLTDPVIKNVPLQKIKLGETVVLNNIFFDTDKYELKKESKAELNKLFGFLNNNPDLKIEISGHTDNVGNAAANKVLSENRAKSVMNYLIDKGINQKRLTAAGYGAEKPIADNNTPEGRAQNRRTEFKVIE